MGKLTAQIESLILPKASAALLIASRESAIL